MKKARPDLTPLDEAFEKAAVPTHAPLPDGDYRVEVESVELRATRGSQRPMLCWTLRVLAPPSFLNRRLWRNQVLAPQNLCWLKRDLLLCGLDLAKLSELPKHLSRLNGVLLDVLKRTQGEYQSVLFRRRVQP